MPTINKLTSVSTLTTSDQVPIYDATNGDARRASLALLRSFCQSGVTAADDKITQYAAPSATAFSVQVTDGDDSVWLILTPTAGFAAGTIVMPAVAKCVHNQEILVNCTQAVTTLTVSGNGATVTGAPTTLAANAFFTLRFDDVTSTWYRVG
jgi:hypothetical protein